MPDDSTVRLWARRTIGCGAILFFLFDGATKLAHAASFLEASVRLATPEGAIPIFGVLPLVLTIFYALPRSAPTAAVVVAAFVGGAIATRILVGDPLLEHAPFPVYSAGFVCGGLLLREPDAARLPIGVVVMSLAVGVAGVANISPTVFWRASMV
jgi:hypothetical protein